MPTEEQDSDQHRQGVNSLAQSKSLLKQTGERRSQLPKWWAVPTLQLGYPRLSRANAIRPYGLALEESGLSDSDLMSLTHPPLHPFTPSPLHPSTLHSPTHPYGNSTDVGFAICGNPQPSFSRSTVKNSGGLRRINRAGWGARQALTWSLVIT